MKYIAITSWTIFILVFVGIIMEPSAEILNETQTEYVTKEYGLYGLWSFTKHRQKPVTYDGVVSNKWKHGYYVGKVYTDEYFVEYSFNGKTHVEKYNWETWRTIKEGTKVTITEHFYRRVGNHFYNEPHFEIVNK